MSALHNAGEAAARKAERLWKLDIIDPPMGSQSPRAAESLKVISDIIKNAGWGWALPYLGNGPPEWCGMFAAMCWDVDPKWFPTYWASTYRMLLWARYKSFSPASPNPPPPPGFERRLLVQIVSRNSLSSVAPRRGDIIIVGVGGSDDAAGDHITVNMGYNHATGAFDTISGNGGGIGPLGNSRSGISRKTYTIGQAGYRPMWLIRPAPIDLIGGMLGGGVGVGRLLILGGLLAAGYFIAKSNVFAKGT
jgi:hypothetical protein